MIPTPEFQNTFARRVFPDYNYSTDQCTWPGSVSCKSQKMVHLVTATSMSIMSCLYATSLAEKQGLPHNSGSYRGSKVQTHILVSDLTSQSHRR